MQQVAGRSGVYRIGAADKVFNVRAQVLEAAVPPVPGALEAPGSYGLVLKGLPMPGTGLGYVVECLDKDTVRVLAYIDPYGRAFSTPDVLAAPPAREPDLDFARFADQSRAGEERGCVEVRDGKGERQTAQYACVRGRYALFDSWYDFGPYGTDLPYAEALARAYLAFVHRPAMGGPSVPERGIGFVFSTLREEKLLPALRSIVRTVRGAEADPVLRPPALAAALARWLGEAGFEQIDARGLAEDSLRLVRTVRYADTFFVAVDDEKASVARREVWALEGVLNRFLLVSEAFGDRASLASDADCARWDAYLIDTAASAPLAFDLASETSPGMPGGEWAVRCAVSAALERLKLPFRAEALLRCDVAEGVAALEVTVPDAGLMPPWRWIDGPAAAPGAPAGGGWAAAPQAAREAQARRYAMHVGLALALAAFESSSLVRRVDLVARPLAAEDAEGKRAADGEHGEFPRGDADAAPACYQVALRRELLADEGFVHAARMGDPAPLFGRAGALFDLPAADPFAVVGALPSAAARRTLPEGADALVPDPLASVLGTGDAAGLRIEADAYRRRIGERLADRIVRSATATEAIRIAREEQDAAEARGDGLAVSACMRLMAALAEGSLDTEDQNAIVGCFLGEDRCLVALGRARTAAAQDPDRAVSILIDAVTETAALDGYVDGAKTAYRSFDSYAARVCYNRALSAARNGQPRPASATGDAHSAAPDAAAPVVPDLALLAAADAPRRIELAPDSFYLCHLEIVRLLEHSFERTDEALRYGRRAIELAPTTAAGYRQLGRAFMLVGDMENAEKTLVGGLNIAVQPDDIAMAYYQLAYVRWKAGDPRAGALCYVKSLATSPVVAMQATAELHELVEETGAALPDKETVDGELEEAGVPVAPTAAMLDMLDQGAAAAADAGMFPAARNLLVLRLRYRPDDALVNVLRSLED